MIPTVLLYQVIRTKYLHDSMVCLTWIILKGTNSQLIFSWTPPGQLRKKTTDLKGSQISEHPGVFFLLKIRQLQLLHERNKNNFLRTTKYSFHLMCTEDCQKLSNKEKETKFNEVIFQNSKLHVLFLYGNTIQGAPMWLVFVRNYEIDKAYNTV